MRWFCSSRNMHYLRILLCCWCCLRSTVGRIRSGSFLLDTQSCDVVCSYSFSEFLNMKISFLFLSLLVIWMILETQKGKKCLYFSILQQGVLVIFSIPWLWLLIYFKIWIFQHHQCYISMRHKATYARNFISELKFMFWMIIWLVRKGNGLLFN